MPVLKITEKAAYDNAVTTLQSEMLRTQGISHVPADAANPDINLKKEHIAIATPIIMEGTQTIPSDLDVAKTSRELITVGSFAKNIQAMMQLFLKKDGSVQMDTGYTPTNDNDLVTKKYYEDNFKPQHLSGTDDPVDTLGDDGDIYFKLG